MGRVHGRKGLVLTRTKNRRPSLLHLQCYMVIEGDVKEPTHLSQRVGNVVPCIVV